jgi:hypothetical protein
MSKPITGSCLLVLAGAWLEFLISVFCVEIEVVMA